MEMVISSLRMFVLFSQQPTSYNFYAVLNEENLLLSRSNSSVGITLQVESSMGLSRERATRPDCCSSGSVRCWLYIDDRGLAEAEI